MAERLPDLAARALLGVAAIVLAIALLIAVTLPYGQFDALAFGTWSRLLAEHFPTFHFSSTDVPVAAYHRPLFFVLQAAAWKVFGFQEWLGRLLSLAFTVLLVASVGVLAARFAFAYKRLAAAAAIVVTLASSELAIHVASGLTDVPAAAMVALVAVAVTGSADRPRLYVAAVVVTAALAGVTKPSAFPALAGLMAAVLLGSRSALRQRAAAALGIAGGLLLALAYDETQARHFHSGLGAFLKIGTGGTYAAAAGARRHDVLLGGGWLGGDLRALLAVSVLYAVARVFSVPHRSALLSAVGAGIAWTAVGTRLAGGHSIAAGNLGGGGALERLSVALLLVSLLLGLAASPKAVLDRILLARLIVWAAPPFVVWSIYAVYDDRLGSTWWPAAFVLMGLMLFTAFAGALAVDVRLLVVPIAALILAAFFNLQNMNGLGASGWKSYRAGGISGLGNAALMRNIGLGGDLSEEVNTVAGNFPKGDRMLSTDGRMRFYYLDRVTSTAPQSCAEVRGYDELLLLESDEMRASLGERALPAFWLACPGQHWHIVGERPGAFALLTTRTNTPSAGGGLCSAPTPTPGLAIEFGRFTSAADAEAKVKAVAAVGFVLAKVEQRGCSDFRVLETGIPSRKAGQEIIAEARSANLDVTLISTP